MARSARLRELSCLWALAALAAGCGDGEAIPSEPPQPSNLAQFDPRVVERIAAARARVAEDPRSATRWAELGMIFGSERLRTLALECFQVAERLEPRQPKWPYREAVTRAQLGELEPAIACMSRSIELEPEYAPSHARLGGYRLELGDLEGAERSFREATRLDSSYPGGWIGIARIELQRDRTAEAIPLLERLQKEDPNDRTFRQLLSNAYRQAGRASDLEVADVLGDEDIPVWNDPWELEARAYQATPTMIRIGRLLEAHRTEEAMKLLDEERARGADSDELARQYGEAYLQLGRTEEARAELERLVARQPDNTATLIQLAQVYEQIGDRQSALAALERVTRLQPDFAGAQAAQGRLLYSQGYFQPAADALEHAIESGVADFEVRYTLGQCWIGLKRWKDAAAIFEHLVVERPENGDSWLELALTRTRSGDRKGGEEAFARAVAAGNSDAKLRANVERVVHREPRPKKGGDKAEKKPVKDS